MNIELIQAMWFLGEFPAANLPSVAGKAMAAGHVGPALLELVSFHKPSIRDFKPGLMEQAFQEMGLDPITGPKAKTLLARRVAESICRQEVRPYEGAKRISNLTHLGPDHTWVGELALFIGYASEWEDLPEFRSRCEKEIMSYAREFLETGGRRLE